MKNMMSYRNFLGSVEYSAEDKCLFGKIQGIDGLINYEGESISELERAFHEAVDVYVEENKAAGIVGLESCKGSFNVRIDPDLHRRVKMRAAEEKLTLNKLVARAIANELERSRATPKKEIPSASKKKKALSAR